MPQMKPMLWILLFMLTWMLAYVIIIELYFYIIQLSFIKNHVPQPQIQWMKKKKDYKFKW